MADEAIPQHSVDVHSRARASVRNRHPGPSNTGIEDEVEQSERATHLGR
jgi:hypothetical protein